jgi:peptidoglycan/LPS O-acetylase OafA/YrhL
LPVRDAPNLDLLRTCAVGLVIVSHLGPAIGWKWDSSFHLQALGLMGVAIFFVHTCLVLMMSMDRDPGERLAARFLIRRAFRIYPLSIVVVVTLAAAGIGRLHAGDFISNLLLVQNITGAPSNPAPLWSLPFEIQMYLVLPALYGLCRRRNAAMLVALLWIASVLVVVGASRTAANYHLLKYVPCFLPGVLAFVLISRTERGPRFGWGTLFAYVAIAAMAFPVVVAKGAEETPLLWLICLGLGLLIPQCRQLGTSWLAAAAKTVATYSYGIYLVHSTCLDIAFGKLAAYPEAVKWLVFIGSTAALSYVGYHLIEKPGIALGIRLSRRYRPKDSSSTAAAAAEAG